MRDDTSFDRFVIMMMHDDLEDNRSPLFLKDAPIKEELLVHQEHLGRELSDACNEARRQDVAGAEPHEEEPFRIMVVDVLPRVTLRVAFATGLSRRARLKEAPSRRARDRACG
jgi:hypothetical protein